MIPTRGEQVAISGLLLAEIERLLSTAVGVMIDAAAPAAARPRLGAISFLHRFGSALNHHVHLHVCATDGVFMPAADDARCDTPPVFLPARPINQADLAALTERVRRRVIRWFRLTRLLDTAAAADMLTWENSGFSVTRETVCAEARKTRSQRGVSGVSAYRETASRLPGRSPRGSWVAHQPGRPLRKCR